MQDSLDPVPQESAVPAAPPSYSDWKRDRAAGTADTPPSDPADTGASAVPSGESAATSAVANKEPQEKPAKAQKTETAEERAAKLRAAGRGKEADRIERDAAEKREFEEYKANRDAEKQRIEALERENAELKTRPAPAASTPAAPQSTPEAPKRLTRKEFFSLPDNQDKPYEDVQESWEAKRDGYIREDSLKEFRESSVAEQRKRTVDERISSVAKDKPDFNAVTVPVAQLLAPGGNLPSFFSEFENAPAVLYAVGKDPAKMAELRGMSPVRQFVELAYISRELSQPAAPETPKAATPMLVSRTPAPPRTLGGPAPAEDDTKPPASFSDWKHRNRRTG